MSMKLEEFRKKYGVRPLAASTTGMQAGSVLKHQGGGRYQPHEELKNVFPDKDWSIRFEDAVLPQGTIEEERNVQGSLNLLGIRIGGEVKKATSVQFVIRKPTIGTFAGFSSNQVRLLLTQLKASNRPLYDSIDERWLVTHAWYAEEVLFSFRGVGSSDLSVEIKRVDIDAGADAAVQWESAVDLVVTNNRNIPFAFWGFQI